MHGQRLVVAHDYRADMRLDISIVLESLLQNLDGLVPHVPGAFRPVEILSGNVIIAICECYHVVTRQLVRLVGDAWIARISANAATLILASGGFLESKFVKFAPGCCKAST